MTTDRLSTDLARRLKGAGFVWHPQSGDAFLLDGPEFEGDVFTISDMTIEPHEFDLGTILGFNGTTEWALDSVALEQTLWLPRESQLRDLLGACFDSLSRHDGDFLVAITLERSGLKFRASTAADAYALALLEVLAQRQRASGTAGTEGTSGTAGAEP